jgi:hypothetical protein
VNPIYDLIVIGIIVSMVLMNLYFSKAVLHKISSMGIIGKKWNSIHPLKQKTAFSPSHVAAHFSQD